MVSFSCEVCGDVLSKRKLDSHRRQCPNASYTCLDCMVNFKRNDYRSHTTCISEAQKYQGALYRSEKEKKTRRNTTAASSPHEQAESKGSRRSKTPTPVRDASAPPLDAGVLRPEVNVFDFLVPEDTETSHGTRRPQHEPGLEALNHVVTSKVLREIQYSLAQNVSSRATSSAQNNGDTVKSKGLKVSSTKLSPVSRYPSVPKQTPVVKQSREGCREKRDGSVDCKQTKRKRLHVDTRDLNLPDEDETMIDAPATISHSNLTGGLNKLMTRTPALPSNPDYPGATLRSSTSPKSPLKKTKHGKKQEENRTVSGGFMSFMTGKRWPPPTTADPSRRQKKAALSENKNSDRNGTSGVVVYQTTSASADLLFSLIDKGLKSSKGVSMKRALRKFHRERELQDPGSSRAMDESELLGLLRLKMNDRGEVVVIH